MIPQSDAILYLASQRGCTETSYYRSYHVFNFGNYLKEHRKAFGNLYGFHDDVLVSNKSIHFTSTENSILFIIPVVGRVLYQINTSEPYLAEVGKVHGLIIEKGAKLMVENPGNELINFIHVWIKKDKMNEDVFVEFKFDLIQNKIVSLRFNSEEGSLQSQLCVGKFGGRAESIHKLKDVGSGAFIFVLEGAFEVNNRLVQARDGLALWNTEEIEFEALSNDAILFIVEC